MVQSSAHVEEPKRISSSSNNVFNYQQESEGEEAALRENTNASHLFGSSGKAQEEQNAYSNDYVQVIDSTVKAERAQFQESGPLSTPQEVSQPQVYAGFQDSSAGDKNMSSDHDHDLDQQNSLGQFDNGEEESGLGDYFTPTALPAEERKQENLERPDPSLIAEDKSKQTPALATPFNESADVPTELGSAHNKQTAAVLFATNPASQTNDHTDSQGTSTVLTGQFDETPAPVLEQSNPTEAKPAPPRVVKHETRPNVAPLAMTSVPPAAKEQA